MIKIWKIGTSISSYIEEWEQWVKQNWTQFTIQHNDTDNSVYFVNQNDEKIKKTKSTAMQIIRVLLSLGLIESQIYTTFDKDKSVIASTNLYSITNLNDGESVADYMTQVLIQKIDDIYENDSPQYPSEETFIFSLLATLHSIIDAGNIKFIDQRIELGKIGDIEKYYSKTAGTLKNGVLYNDLVTKSKQHILGMRGETIEISKSIDSSPSVNRTNYYSPLNLEKQLESTPLTFGIFINDYFTIKSSLLIPVYQRKYIWPISTVRTLLYDIKNIDKHSTHYIGNIIVKTPPYGDKEVKIIDGQQRITTLLLIFRALFDYTKFRKLAVDNLANDKLANYSNPSSILNGFKRVMGNDDYDAFKEVIVGNGFKKTELKSNILEIYKSIFNWMSANLATKDEIELFWSHLLNGIVMVIIDDKVSNEFKLFEKLNTNGVQLSTIELFKNFILERFNQENELDEKKAQETFETKIIGKFDSTNTRGQNTDIENFLITSIRMNTSKLSNETIFNQYKDWIVTNYEQNNPDITIQEILDEISNEISIFTEMNSYKRYSKSSSFLHGFADFLYMFDGRKVYFPIFLRLFKIHIKDIKKPTITEINKVREFLRILEIFEVRLQVASYRGQSLSVLVEKILNDLKPETTPSEFWKLVAGNEGSSTGMVNIDRFKQNLASLPISNKPARLIITRLENYFALNNNWNYDKDTQFVSLYNEPSQREHLLPSKWIDQWESDLVIWTGLSGKELDKAVSEKVNMIGNAFAIPGWSNNKIKNSNFNTKINILKKDNYYKRIVIFNGIHGKLDGINSSFTPEHIQKRSSQIAEIASEIWCDYE